MSKIYEKLKADYKKANKDYKLKLLAKYGFATEAEFLEVVNALAINKNIKPLVRKLPTKKPIVHLVDILDASGSMGGDKMDNANKAIAQGIEESKQETKVDYTYSLISFSGSGDIREHNFKSPIKNVGYTDVITRGMTALYQTIGVTLTKLKESVKTGEKVLVKIYTDGGENASVGKWRNAKDVSALIKELETLGFTITFIGTAQDVLHVVNNININLTNTMSYDGTAKGLNQAMYAANTATKTYADKLSRGIDVGKGFYKKTGELV